MADDDAAEEEREWVAWSVTGAENHTRMRQICGDTKNTNAGSSPCSSAIYVIAGSGKKQIGINIFS